MKQILFVLLLISTSAWAEWTNIGNTTAIDGYLDASTIRKKGNNVKMWVLYDYKATQKQVAGKPFLSAIGQEEFDCEDEQMRTLAFILYSGNMRNGDIVHSMSSPDEWSPVPPGSIAKIYLDIACGKQGKTTEIGEKGKQESIEPIMARIVAKIRSRVVLPPDLRGNPEVTYEVTLFANGSVNTASLTKSSGVPTYDEAVLRAIHAAEPWPLPADADLFKKNFQTLRLSFRPIE